MNGSTILDKSDTQLLTKLYLCAQIVARESEEQFEKLREGFLSHRYFPLLLKQENLVQFLEHSSQMRESEALLALILAFCFPSTVAGIMGISKGLFGEDSQIRILEEPGVVALEILNANSSFVRGFLSLVEDRPGIADSQGRWIVFRVFDSLKNSDLHSFLLQFLSVGVVFQVRLLSANSNP